MIDSYIIIGYVVLVLCIGIVSSFAVSKPQDYLVASKETKFYILLPALFATIVGGGTTIGICEKIFNIGLPFIIAICGLPVYKFILARFIIPKMHRFRHCLSSGEVMCKIYDNNQKIRILTGIFACLSAIGYVGAQIAALGYLIQFMLGIDYTIGTVFISIVVIIYSGLGGMKSVTYTDVVQFIIMMISIPIIFWIAIDGMGGYQAILSNIPYSKTIDANPHTYKYIFLCVVFMIPELDPCVMQRLLMSKNVKKMHKIMYANALLDLPFLFMVVGIGITVMVMQPPINGHEALFYLIREYMPLGIKGLVISGILAVIMSTVDSYLHIAGTSCVYDVINPIFFPNASDKSMVSMMRISSFIVGFIGIVIALSVHNVFSIILYAKMLWTPMITASLLLGIRKTVKLESRSFVISLIITMCVCISLSIYNNICNNIMGVETILFAGLLCNISCLVLLSLCTSPLKKCITL